MTKAKPIFRKVDAHHYSKLGVRRKKKVKYRFPRGRDNKIRMNKFGKLRKVKVGFKNENAQRNMINGNKVIMIYNVNDIDKIKKGMIGIIGKLGNRKKKIIAEKIIENKTEVYRFDASSFLKKLENNRLEAREIKNKRKSEKLVRDKKSKEKENKTKEEKDKNKEDDNEKKLESKIEDKIKYEGEEK